MNKTLGENTIYQILMGLTVVRATELYSSGEKNAAFSYIILRLTYIRGLIHGIGRGVRMLTKLKSNLENIAHEHEF